ncbi:hypothetical protein [Leptospira levettii]|uniref:Uncharacterized protein n=1 Tax=Leptospira levettii TaxID=2023178 RepID=A0AAW5VBB8_9LEPT|nr:hypothetical protein [Leptospira levettii]MCW7467678.1 hypothetical protein [Leptospira levettii]MCW7513358.1 hypothetical protein [Leptospira levettii]MCW7517081.1 hypothetical protein [Leptospira levettii]
MFTNKEEIIFYLTAISSFGTVLASLFTLLNFREIRKQRIQSYSPALILANTKIFLYYLPRENFKFSFLPKELEFDIEQTRSNQNDSTIYVPLINLGSPTSESLVR